MYERDTNLCGRIGEKFIEWTDTTPDYEEILDSVTLYWFTESIARGLYPYRTVVPHPCSPPLDLKNSMS
jgi:hypothetical protein